MHFVVTITCSRQIGIEDWEVYYPTCIITHETTMADIYRWAEKEDKNWKQLRITMGQFHPL